ncbi:MAG: DUF3891 family protein [Candidatus Sumerlaeaceae bacterium]
MIRKLWNRDKWLLTPQIEHARLAGLIAASWNYSGDKPSDEVIQSIRRHDDGWKEADETPLVNAAGAPMNFDEGELARSTGIWSRSSQLLADEGKLVGAALVASHFLYFAENTVDLSKASARAAVAAGKFIAQQRALVQKAKSASSTISDSEFQKHLRLLQVCDAISILLCGDFIGEHQLVDVPYLDGSTTLNLSRKSDNLTLTLSPLPFKKNLRDHVNCFIVPRRIYETSEELQSTLKSTRASNNEVHLGGS